MEALRRGDSNAGARLMELFHPELKRLAAGHLKRERDGHSWQPTLLVNELYLQLVQIKGLKAVDSERQNEKAAFFALAGQIMKRLLIHHARPLAAKAKKVPVIEKMPADSDTSLLEVEQLLTRLEAIKPDVRKVVEMRVFEGRTAEEIAAELKCSAVTVNRYWRFACQWLRSEWAPRAQDAIADRT